MHLHGADSALLLPTLRERSPWSATTSSISTRIERLIAALFELSKLEAGAIVPAPESFSITELIQDIALRFRLRAQQLGIELTAQADPLAPNVCADIALIERVFENLLDNALRYTHHCHVLTATREGSAYSEPRSWCQGGQYLTRAVSIPE